MYALRLLNFFLYSALSTLSPLRLLATQLLTVIRCRIRHVNFVKSPLDDAPESHMLEESNEIMNYEVIERSIQNMLVKALAES